METKAHMKYFAVRGSFPFQSPPPCQSIMSFCKVMGNQHCGSSNKARKSHSSNRNWTEKYSPFMIVAKRKSVITSNRFLVVRCCSVICSVVLQYKRQRNLYRNCPAISLMCNIAPRRACHYTICHQS